MMTLGMWMYLCRKKHTAISVMFVLPLDQLHHRAAIRPTETAVSSFRCAKWLTESSLRSIFMIFRHSSTHETYGFRSIRHFLTGSLPRSLLVQFRGSQWFAWGLCLSNCCSTITPSPGISYFPPTLPGGLRLRGLEHLDQSRGDTLRLYTPELLGIMSWFP